MRAPVAPSLVAAAAALLAACAHAPSLPQAEPSPPPSWPAPPAEARVRWVASVPSGERPVETPPWWRRAIDAVLGIDPDGPPARLLERPFGVAVDGDALVVADPDGAQVLIVDWRRGTHRPLECAARPWQAPMGVAVAPDHTRFVADAAGVIARITPAGACTVFGAGALRRPTGVAWLDGRVWAVDPPAHVVVVFTPEGQELFRFGGIGEGPDQLHFPTALAAAGDGTVLVVDALNFRIVRFGADGKPIRDFGRAGEEESSFGRPKAVAVGAGGAVYVTDASSDYVKRFSARGRFELAFGGSGSGRGELLLPAGIAVGQGYVFVADAMNGRIQIFQLVGET